MGVEMETLGNAMLQFREGGRMILTTDPWLTGTCYFGSWGMDKPLSHEQIRRAQESPYVWISHGHPDHLHPESLELLPRTTHILLPDHYDREIFHAMQAKGFRTTILPDKTWMTLSGGIRVMCLGNENQDGILVVHAGDALVVNLNDSPLCGHGAFLKRLVKSHPNEKTYLTALCSIDADMINIVDEQGRSLAGPPDERKPGTIWNVAGIAAFLGVKNFCCSSSQHIYVRSDSAWANPYRIGWSDMRKWWSRPEIRLLEPYVTVDLSAGKVKRNHPSQASDYSQVTDATGNDDWEAKLDEREWKEVEAFAKKFQIIQDKIDFLAFTVGGEKRRFLINPRANPQSASLRGIHFRVPKQSLMETVEYGYFDDLLIGNFMKTELVNTKLYPNFSTQVAKLGGNAKVYTRAQHSAFLRHYFRRDPRAFLANRVEQAWFYHVLPGTRRAAEKLGVKPVMKKLYRRYLRRDPVDGVATSPAT